MSRTNRLLLPGPLAIRVVLWLAVFFVFPFSGTAASVSFELEVLGRTIPQLCASPRECAISDFSDRVLVRLVEAESRESDAWFRDDYRIARVTVGLARSGNPLPHVEASYAVLGLHPSKVWPSILLNREVMLGALYEKVSGGKLPPKKPSSGVNTNGARVRSSHAA